jgi:glycerol-3-phosphate cytidylyltransferase
MPLVGYASAGFDLFHVGHLNLLRNAKARCDYLIAGVVSDEVLRITKGIDPVIPANQRLEIVRNVRCVDDAVIATQIAKSAMWNVLRFDVLFEGDDWKGSDKGAALERELASVGIEVVYLPRTPITSSTTLRNVLYNLDRLLQQTASTASDAESSPVHPLSAAHHAFV